MNELELKLIQLVEAMGITVDEAINTAISNLSSLNATDVANLQAKIDMIEVALDGVADGEITVAQNVLAQLATIAGRVTVNESDIALLKAFETATNAAIVAIQAKDVEQDGRLTAVEAAIGGAGGTSLSDRMDAVEAVNAVQDTHLIATDAEQAVQDGRLTANEGAITTLNGADTVVGSVAKSIKDAVAAEAAIRSAADATDAANLVGETSARVTADSALQTQIDNLNTRTTASITELEVTQAGAGLAVDGTFVADVATNFISGATTSRNESKLLDAALKVEVTARVNGDTATLASANTHADATVAAEEAARIAADAVLAAQITTVETTINDNITNLQAEIVAAQAAEQTNSDAIAVLNGLDTVVGSVAKSIKDSQDAQNTAQAAVDATQDGRLDTIEASISTGGGLEVRVATNEANIVTLTNNKLDTSKVVSVSVLIVDNAFRAKLGLAPKV